MLRCFIFFSNLKPHLKQKIKTYYINLRLPFCWFCKITMFQIVYWGQDVTPILIDTYLKHSFLLIIQVLFYK